MHFVALLCTSYFSFVDTMCSCFLEHFCSLSSISVTSVVVVFVFVSFITDIFNELPEGITVPLIYGFNCFLSLVLPFVVGCVVNSMLFYFVLHFKLSSRQ